MFHLLPFAVDGWVTNFGFCNSEILIYHRYLQNNKTLTTEMVLTNRFQRLTTTRLHPVDYTTELLIHILDIVNKVT